MSNEKPDKEALAEGQDESAKRKVGQGRSLPTYIQPAHVEAVLAGYPEAARPAILWLAAYCRDFCQSDHKILAAHTVQAECSRSFSYFYAVFRGTADLSGADAISGLVSVFAKLKSHHAKSVERGDDIFGDTELYGAFEAMIVSRRKAHIRNRLVLVSGPTGSGKSELIAEFIRRHGAKLNLGLVDSAQKPSLYDWLPILCRVTGVSPTGRQETKAEEVINNAKTFDVLFLDDTHRLYREGAGTNQACWNFIQRLHDQTTCVIVATMTHVFKGNIRKIRYFDQFFGRAGGRGNLFEMPDFPEDDQILAVAKAYGLTGAREHLEQLRGAAHSYERLRPLQDALAMARGDSKDGKFTFDDLEPFLPPAMDPGDEEKTKPGRRK